VRFAAPNAGPAAYRAVPAFNWSDLESRLGDLAKFSTELSSELAVEPHVTLAHDPLALFEELNRRDQLPPRSPPASNEAFDAPAQAEPQARPKDRGRDPLEMLPLLAAFSSTSS
jgi:hypothetical protein